MKPFVRTALPLISFVIALTGTAGLTLWAAESNAPAKANKSARGAGQLVDSRHLVSELAIVGAVPRFIEANRVEHGNPLLHGGAPRSRGTP